MAHIPSDIAELLNVEAERLNSPDFIAADPVQFPRRYTEQRDVEPPAKPVVLIITLQIP